MNELRYERLLVANRGEIAVRIIRSAEQLEMTTLAIYTPSDSFSPHVLQADIPIPLPVEPSQSESAAYLSASTILSICKKYAVTMVHPGYGFLSENSEFAMSVVNAGITWLGPKPEIIRLMGLKHEARAVAIEAGIPVIPGSDGLVTKEDAVDVASRVGFPLMLKATAGGGGLGMVVCANEKELEEKLTGTIQRAQTLFHNNGVFLERYISAARHIEVQVFGNGLGDVVHMGERECSVQRRNQKIIEETPSPFFSSREDIREKMCEAALKLCKTIKYSSAGTVEFIVDETTGEFFFLEMNTRIQVEHPITEAVHPKLDLVKLMILQGAAEKSGSNGLSVTLPEMQQDIYLSKTNSLHAIEVRVYAEDPSAAFRPCPGILQHVDLDAGSVDWLRVDNWVSTGTTITPFFDPLLCKLIVSASTRVEALSRLAEVLRQVKIQGPPNNLEYLAAIIANEAFQAGNANTKFLDTFEFCPKLGAFTIIAPGFQATVQDYPGRTVGLGVPRSGPMDSLAFRAANILSGNPQTTEGLEIIVVPGFDFEAKFHVTAVATVTGKDVLIFVDNNQVQTWKPIVLPGGCTLSIRATSEQVPGMRTYLAIRGGFPNIPQYLGSKSTSMGFGGYQGRALLPGDQIALGDAAPSEDEPSIVVDPSHRPNYTSHWQIYVLSGPHDDEEFITSEGIDEFYSTEWRVSPSSNQMGIRLESVRRIQWARKNGGEGGSHPSNILDNGYAPGTVNINGDTPVILTNEGPDMGGYVCLCTVAVGDMWKLGQVSPGSTIMFQRISWDEARILDISLDQWLKSLQDSLSSRRADKLMSPYNVISTELETTGPKLHVDLKTSKRPQVVYRQAGDSAILVEFGAMTLDFQLRARIHAFETAVKEQDSVCSKVIQAFCPCIRSTMCFFDPSLISQKELLGYLVSVEQSLPDSVSGMTFPGRRITFPIVLDDSWNQEAISRYMRTIRDKAVYLPSNVEYLARNNGFNSGAEALKKLVGSDWLVFGVGFYLACPFLVPIDPRCRLVGQKMNPSRTFTPRGAIGIAGVVAAIYPVESPGGYQLFGRTLPAWQTWGRGQGFDSTKPWLLRPFDQASGSIHFEPVGGEEYLELEKLFDAGKYIFKIETTVFSMPGYLAFAASASVYNGVKALKAKQAKAVGREESREEVLLKEWELEKSAKQEAASLSDYAGKWLTPESPIISDGEIILPAPLFSSIWQIRCQPGDIIETGDEILIVLEAMKTEVPVKAGAKYIGKTIKGLAKGVKIGESVASGDALVILR